MRRGYTLAEVVVTAGIMSMFLLATPWAVRLATKAIPDGRSTPSAALVAAKATDLIHADVQFATAVAASTPTTLTFTVADRTGDAAAETITYAWSGAAGAPLTRSFNGGTPSAIANNVQEFQLLYDKRTAPLATTFGESNELLLTSYDSTSGTGNEVVTNTHSVGQYLLPALAANVQSWLRLTLRDSLI